MAIGWNLWVWLVGVAVRCIDILIIIITFPYSTFRSSSIYTYIPKVVESVTHAGVTVCKPQNDYC